MTLSLQVLTLALKLLIVMKFYSWPQEDGF